MGCRRLEPANHLHSRYNVFVSLRRSLDVERYALGPPGISGYALLPNGSSIAGGSPVPVTSNCDGRQLRLGVVVNKVLAVVRQRRGAPR